MVGVDGGIGGEWVGEDKGFGELVVDPMATVLDRHQADDDVSINRNRRGFGFLRDSNVFAIGGIVSHRGAGTWERMTMAWSRNMASEAIRKMSGTKREDGVIELPPKRLGSQRGEGWRPRHRLGLRLGRYEHIGSWGHASHCLQGIDTAADLGLREGLARLGHKVSLLSLGLTRLFLGTALANIGKLVRRSDHLGIIVK